MGSYVPRQWYSEDKITKGALNHIEDGIVDAHTEINYTEQEVADLKFLGWTVPREMPIKNYVDDDGKFHQRVGRVDLGSLSWGYSSGSTQYFYATMPSDTAAPSGNGVDAYTANYSNAKDLAWDSFQTTSKTYQLCSRTMSPNNKTIAVKDSSFSDATAFRNSVSGQYLYYPLATEVVIAEGGEKLNDLIIIRSYQSAPISINANAAKDVSFTLEQIPGYKPLAVIGYRNNTSNSIFVSQSAVGVSEANTGFPAWAWNAHTVNYNNVVITAYVMYIRK